MTLDHLLTIGVVGLSIVAAAAWLRSATAKVRVPQEQSKTVDYNISLGDEPGEYRLVIDGIDVLRTAAKQSRWNAVAAAAACAAALLQAWQATLHWSSTVS